ncbi:sn-glycerol-1-phosphate dehydrogenase [Rhodospirillaceae bacterium SYSU D60014]|uniref:sn-glycerol-1-phosphate dehydrogenase n=1 Tax=Virgifigura deserti TaxID=2268457 RepID=UPI000E66463F
MTINALERLLSGTFADPDVAAMLSVPTRSVVIAESLAGAEADLVAPLALGRRVAVVADPRTQAVLGGRVADALAKIGSVSPIILSPEPHADMETTAMVRETARSVDALVAVGSGTINDLCKLAAAQLGKPYIVFGTAPSMNGYTSISAAITDNAVKKSLAAKAPVGVFLDLTVLAAAPKRMIRSGLGDSLCRTTAQADWLMAHLLFDQPYRSAPFALLAEDEADLFGSAAALVTGDLTAMRCLARTLVLSGFGMTICGGSHPASQGEHLISHYVDMMADETCPKTFHGEQIGVTTLTMAALQHRMLADQPPQLSATAIDRQSVIDHFGSERGEECWREFAPKRLDDGRAAQLNARLVRDWSGIRQEILAILRPVAELEATLMMANCPTTPEALGWPPDLYGNAVRHARELRGRYTFLDLAVDAGVL